MVFCIRRGTDLVYPDSGDFSEATIPSYTHIAGA